MAKAKQREKAEPLFVNDVRVLDYVNDEATFYVTLQFGASVRWREFSSGSWVEDRSYVGDKPTDKRHIHVPAIHESIGPFSGRMINGLIAEHNSWKEQNSQRVRGGGEIQFQKLVLAIEETDDQSLDNANRATRFEGMIRSIVKETTTEMVPAVVKAVVEAMGK